MENKIISKVNIEITEGCINFSYLINGIEWVDYTSKESEHYNIEFIDDVCCALISEVKKQYNLPSWIVEYLYDGDYETVCEQDTFVKLVQNNKNTKEECLGTCDECGDTVYRWKLEINIE